LNTPLALVPAYRILGLLGLIAISWTVPPSGPGHVLSTAAKTLVYIKICKDIQLNKKPSQRPRYRFISQILLT
jgi:hypothetical protein